MQVTASDWIATLVVLGLPVLFVVIIVGASNADAKREQERRERALASTPKGWRRNLKQLGYLTSDLADTAAAAQASRDRRDAKVARKSAAKLPRPTTQMTARRKSPTAIKRQRKSGRPFWGQAGPQALRRNRRSHAGLPRA